MNFTATTRKTQGTGASRRLRRADKVPGIVYGNNLPATPIVMDHNPIFYALRKEAFHSSVLTLNLDGKDELVVLRSFQLHPYKQQVLHIDFQRVDPNVPMNMRVPLHFAGAENSPAVKISKGLISHLVSFLEVRCLPKDLPAFIIKRLPVRLTFDNNYFNALYQGIPVGGYTKMIANLLDGIEVRLNTDYLENKAELDALADKIVYTGPIDAYFDYKLGTLEYRSVRFENELLDKPNFQGNAAVNYTDRETPWTRIIEHKWFEFGTQPKTVISREYSSEWHPGDEPYYPVNDQKNGALYAAYQAMAEKETKILFGGRLGEYKYYDMDAVIAAALKKSQQEMGA